MVIAHQKNQGHATAENAFVIVTNMRNQDFWDAGKGKGTTNIIKIQLTFKTTAFEGHCYPCDYNKYDVERSTHDVIEIRTDAWAGTEVSQINATKRTMK
jgi:hypothetical protein